MSKIGVIVLAAGAGRRLGAGPKAHVALGAETLLSRVVRSCRVAGLEDICVVGSLADPAIERACAALGVALERNAEPDRGMFSSVRVGLRAIAGAWSGGAIVFPVDVPLVLATTVASLARALSTSGDDAWVRPVHEGRRGHPVALGAGLFTRLLALGPTMPLRDALGAVEPRSVDVHCADAGIVIDIDTIDDLAAVRSRVEGRAQQRDVSR